MRLRHEDGNVLVTAVMMMALMLVLGASALSTVDTQTDVTKRQRQHESSFNLAEGALNAQTFVLGRLGTGSPSSQFPTTCTHLSTELLCPSPAQLTRNYDGATQNDFETGTSWWTQVRDNPNGTLYETTTVAAAARYDANEDKRLWVTSQSTVRDRTRTLVALIKVEDRPVGFPQYALLGGWFATSNNGRKEIVNATGSFGVGVRCGSPPPSAGCLDYDPSKGQLVPAGQYQLNYPTEPAISEDELQALEDVAKARGTYYTSCPSNPNGAVVVVTAGNCSYNNSAPAAAGMSKCCNAPTDPGLLIVKCGSVSFGGNIVFYGIVYVPNKSTPEGSWCSSGAVITTQGNAVLAGGAMIDGPGGLMAGSSGNQLGNNVMFFPAAFDNISTAGTAGVVQNTWREIPDDN
jgi:Tfp pilus assembly protein PilX